MKTSILKTLLAAIVAAIGFTALPTSAEAGGCSQKRYSHKCGGCGGSIYKKHVVVRKDRCGRPIRRWVRITHRCPPPRPPSCSHSGHGHGHGHDKIRPGEIIIPILNFIASQQNRNRSHDGGRRGYSY